MYIANTTIPLVVEMYPNPKNISIDSSKIFSKTQTLGGFVFEHWGEEPQTMRVKGRTQGLVGDFNNELAVEATLFQLQQLYRLDKRETLSLLPRLKLVGQSLFSSNARSQLQNGTITPASLRQLSNTFIYYRYDIYFGFFTKFHWEQDAETTPRHYEYEFEFLATSTAQNWLADSIFLPSTANGAAVATAIGLAASAPAIVNMIKGFTTLGQDITNGGVGSALVGGAVASSLAAQVL